MISIEQIKAGFQEIQDNISEWLIKVSGQKYLEDVWDYQKGKGGGRSRIWESEGEHVEKGGVLFSAIEGESLPNTANNNESKVLPNTPFKATGVSVIIHPRSPLIPTIHMNVRYFESTEKWWFGGGIDLTPNYITKERCIQFHTKLKEICDKHGTQSITYKDGKEVADKYFFLPHRGECRGIGGVFFDNLDGSKGTPKEEIWNFIFHLGQSFVDCYSPFWEFHMITTPYTNDQREWQLYRRGRYVEFNLLFDRGTKFGIMSEGRAESILLSLPAVCKWKYTWKPEPHSIEAEFVSFFLKPQDWVGLSTS